MSKALLLLALLACAALAASLRSESAKKPTVLRSVGSYGYYKFARTWPGTTCRTKKCSPSNVANYKADNFDLHGLWPSLGTSDSCKNIQNCRAETYNEGSLQQSTVAQLDSYWVGLYSSSQTFRKHEWEKHGTCWVSGASSSFRRLLSKVLGASQNDQDTYFAEVLSAHSKYNLVHILSANDITPSDTKSYTAAAIKRAIAEASNGVSPSLACSDINGKQYI